jgi:hypothetical protein
MIPIDYNNPNDPWLHNGYDPYKGLSDEERIKAGCMQVVAFIVMIIVGLALCALFGSCTTTKYVPVIEHHTDTLIQTKIMKDSVYLKDSTNVSEKGDTVKIEHWRTEFVKKEVHDTIYISKTDSVPAPYPVIKEVPAELNWWQRLKMRAGGLAILLYLLAFLIWIWRTR